MSLDAGLAPTGESHSGEWECMECGYVEAGVKTKRPRACPECGAPDQALEFFPYGDDDEEDWGEGPVDDEAPGDLADDKDADLR
jgi:hypothetical protein